MDSYRIDFILFIRLHGEIPPSFRIVSIVPFYLTFMLRLHVYGPIHFYQFAYRSLSVFSFMHFPIPFVAWYNLHAFA
jgi:hypothetical protein